MMQTNAPTIRAAIIFVTFSKRWDVVWRPAGLDHGKSLDRVVKRREIESQWRLSTKGSKFLLRATTHLQAVRQMVFTGLVLF